jgi:N-acetylmuramoyl-L-alanine amidase
MQIDFQMSPNFRVGREGHTPEAFVLHVTEGNFSGALAWCLNPSSQVSYHYLINQNGEITQMVEDKDTAWHAGLMKNPTPLGKT